MTTPQARLLIGKKVAWTEVLDRYRGTYKTYVGMIEEVTGKNVCISGDYKWLPSLKDLREATEEDLKVVSDRTKKFEKAMG